MRYVVHAHAARNGLVGLALTLQAQGQSAEAWETLDLLSRFDLDLVGLETDDTRALQARLALAQGDLESAHRWADSVFRAGARPALDLDAAVAPHQGADPAGQGWPVRQHVGT